VARPRAEGEGVLIVIGVTAGVVSGVWAAWLWGLRKAQGVRPELLVVVLTLIPIAYFWGAEAFGWPTPRTIAESYGLGARARRPRAARGDRSRNGGGRRGGAGEVGRDASAGEVVGRPGVTDRARQWSCHHRAAAWAEVRSSSSTTLFS